MICGSVEGADSSTGREQTMPQRKDDESVLSHNEETLAFAVANSSTDTVERPNAILDASESGGDLPRERRRIRRMWKVICRGTRRLGRVLFPCLLTRTTED